MGNGNQPMKIGPRKNVEPSRKLSFSLNDQYSVPNLHSGSLCTDDDIFFDRDTPACDEINFTEEADQEINSHYIQSSSSQDPKAPPGHKNRQASGTTRKVGATAGKGASLLASHHQRVRSSKRPNVLRGDGDGSSTESLVQSAPNSRSESPMNPYKPDSLSFSKSGNGTLVSTPSGMGRSPRGRDTARGSHSPPRGRNISPSTQRNLRRREDKGGGTERPQRETPLTKRTGKARERSKSPMVTRAGEQAPNDPLKETTRDKQTANEVATNRRTDKTTTSVNAKQPRSLVKRAKAKQAQLLESHPMATETDFEIDLLVDEEKKLKLMSGGMRRSTRADLQQLIQYTALDNEISDIREQIDALIKLSESCLMDGTLELLFVSTRTTGIDSLLAAVLENVSVVRYNYDTITSKELCNVLNTLPRKTSKLFMSIGFVCPGGNDILRVSVDPNTHIAAKDIYDGNLGSTNLTGFWGTVNKWIDQKNNGTIDLMGANINKGVEEAIADLLSVRVSESFNIHESVVYLLSDNQVATVSKYFNLQSLITWQLRKKSSWRAPKLHLDTEEMKGVQQVFRKGRFQDTKKNDGEKSPTKDCACNPSMHGLNELISELREADDEPTQVMLSAQDVSVVDTPAHQTKTLGLLLSKTRHSDSDGAKSVELIQSLSDTEWVGAKSSKEKHRIVDDASSGIQTHEKWLEALSNVKEDQDKKNLELAKKRKRLITD